MSRKQFLAVLLVIGAVLFIYGYASLKQEEDTKTTATNLGTTAVKLMYEFDDVNELDQNQTKLKNICSEEIFAQVTIDLEERLLGTYLKFKNLPCKVKVIYESNDLVMYRLISESIAESRLFAFVYKSDGSKITYVREAECLEFIPYSD